MYLLVVVGLVRLAEEVLALEVVTSDALLLFLALAVVSSESCLFPHAPSLLSPL